MAGGQQEEVRGQKEFRQSFPVRCVILIQVRYDRHSFRGYSGGGNATADDQLRIDSTIFQILQCIKGKRTALPGPVHCQEQQAAFVRFFPVDDRVPGRRHFQVRAKGNNTDFVRRGTVIPGRRPGRPFRGIYDGFRLSYGRPLDSVSVIDRFFQQVREFRIIAVQKSKGRVGDVHDRDACIQISNAGCCRGRKDQVASAPGELAFEKARTLAGIGNAVGIVVALVQECSRDPVDCFTAKLRERRRPEENYVATVLPEGPGHERERAGPGPSVERILWS